MIHHLAPPRSGRRVYTFSVQRREDGALFDFEQSAFRPSGDVPPQAVTKPMVCQGRDSYAAFDHMKDGEKFIISIYDIKLCAVVAELPVPSEQEERPDDRRRRRDR
jgi:hypothetical protein